MTATDTRTLRARARRVTARVGNRPERRSARTAILVTAATIALGLTAAAGLLAFPSQTGDINGQATLEAKSAAGPLTERVLTYDYRSFDRDLAHALAGTTGAFHDQLQALSTQRLRPTVLAEHATAEAHTVRSAIASADADKVTALIYVNQRTRRDGLAAPRLDTSAVQATLANVDGAWRLAEFRQL